jgi:hypothetical protein
MKPDTAALAANDDTHVKSVGEHLDQAAANVQEQTPPAAGEPAQSPDTPSQSPAAGPVDGTSAGEIAPAPEPPPEIPSAKEEAQAREIAALQERLRMFEERREKEQTLLSQRDSALHAIEGAKARAAAEKKGLAEVEEEIAALLKEPMPMPLRFESTPIGQAIEEAKQEPATAPPAPPASPAWETLLPPVTEDRVRMLDTAAGDELPTVDALCAALLKPEAMAGEKRALKQTVQVYGTPWLVTHLWKDEASGGLRANVLRLYTKDEWQQTHEAKLGRAVQDFDQNDEAKVQRQVGGEWCGLVVKVGRKVWVVGPQSDALHLAYLPPEPAQEGAESAPEPAEGAQAAPADAPADASAHEAGAGDAAADLEWAELRERAKLVIEATGMTTENYAAIYKLPEIALVQFISAGKRPDDEQTARLFAELFPEFEDGAGDEEADDSGSQA